jgi:hypothetical protein
VVLVSGLTVPAPVSDECVLEQLEARFLRGSDVWPSSSELALAEMLAPAIGRVDDDPVCRMSKRRTIRYCCDTG